MKPFIIMLSVLCLITACSSLPEIKSTGSTALPASLQKCRQIFPQGRWQFLHTIEATMPGGKKGTLMGVTVVSSRDKTVQTVIMTIEGMVLFDARDDQQLVINRALPPFDSQNFARGLMKDIRLVFFEPRGPLINSGTLKNREMVCRYQNPDGQMVDIVHRTDDSWEIRQYTKSLRLNRTIGIFFNKTQADPDLSAIPERLELTAHGHPGYTLDMRLLEAIPLDRNP
jgi:hypothetical protein